MQDIIIDDTKSSLAATSDILLPKNKTQERIRLQPRKKKRGFGAYITDWFERGMIVSLFLIMDFLLFAGAGSYNMFDKGYIFNLEIWYILAGIGIFSFALIYLVSFSRFLQNFFAASSMALFIVLLFNQFAAFDKNSMLSSFASMYISENLGVILTYVSHVFVAVLIAFVFFLFLVYASRAAVAVFIVCMILLTAFVVYVQNKGQIYNVKQSVVSVPVIRPIVAGKPLDGNGKKFVFIAMPTLGSYNYFNNYAAEKSKIPAEYAKIQKSLDMMLGFFAKNGFTFYPNAYVNKVDSYQNVAQTLNLDTSEADNEYLQNNLLVTRFWKFNNLAEKYVYMKRNRLFDAFKKARYGVNAYQAGGIDMCVINGESAVNKCVEKNNLPIDFDGMQVTTWDKAVILAVQWLESMDLFNDLSLVYDVASAVTNVNQWPWLGVSYKGVEVKNSLDILDTLEKDISQDKGDMAYFVYLNMPENFYMYDQYCKIKPYSEWTNKNANPWIKNVVTGERFDAYVEQLSCVYGRLQQFIDRLSEMKQDANTVIVIQGANGMNNENNLKEENFIQEIRNHKFSNVAIKDPLKQNFEVKMDFCSAPNIVKQYLFGKGDCSELAEFNMHPEAAEKMKISLANFVIDDAKEASAVKEYGVWYKKWLDNQKAKEPKKTVPLMVSEKALPGNKKETKPKAKEQVEKETLKVKSAAGKKPEIKVKSEVKIEEKPAVNASKAVEKAPVAEENILDAAPEVVLDKTPQIKEAVENPAEEKVESFNDAINREEAVSEVKGLSEPEAKNTVSAETEPVAAVQEKAEVEIPLEKTGLEGIVVDGKLAMPEVKP